jgi:hypothetical protein
MKGSCAFRLDPFFVEVAFLRRRLSFGRLAKIVRALNWILICVVLPMGGCGGDALRRDLESAQSDLSAASQSRSKSAQEIRQDLDAVISRREVSVLDCPPQFTEVSSQQGIEFTFHTDAVPGRYFLPEIMGGGAAWFDFDRDGWLDLFLVNGDELESGLKQPKPHSDALFQNRGGESFVEISGAARATTIGYGQGCAVGDFDGDGFEDLYVTGYRTSTLLRNLGDGTFADETVESGTRNDRWGSGVVWLDINDDRLLDLFVVNYLNVTPENREQCRFSGVPGYCGPGHYEAVEDRLFLNLGEGRFRDVSEEVGVTIPDGKGLGVAVLDFDLDGRNEIYVANDMTPNFLFQRQAVMGTGADRSDANDVLPKFRDVAPIAGCAVSDMGLNEASMGVACADFDGNGFCDIFLTHFYAQKNTLYRNLGGLQFEDDSRRARLVAISHDRLGFGTVPLDYDRDGATDLLIANGHVLGPEHTPFAMRPQLMRNDGQARFEDVGPQSGDYFQQLCVGRGAAGADFDHDGDLDLLVTHLDRPVALLRNDTATPHHYLGIELRRADRLPPQGTQVIVTAGDRRITSMSIGGGSYLCVSDPRLLIGLKDWSDPVTLEIRWQSGPVARYENVAVDRYWLVQEGRELRPSFQGASPP